MGERDREGERELEFEIGIPMGGGPPRTLRERRRPIIPPPPVRSRLSLSLSPPAPGLLLGLVDLVGVVRCWCWGVAVFERLMGLSTGEPSPEFEPGPWPCRIVCRLNELGLEFAVDAV